jgi:hypothetical protein
MVFVFFVPFFHKSNFKLGTFKNVKNHILNIFGKIRLHYYSINMPTLWADSIASSNNLSSLYEINLCDYLPLLKKESHGEI